MERLHVLCFLFLLEIFSKDQTNLIQTQKDVQRTAGEDVHLSFQLLETKEVLQVTWQKIFKEKEITIASFDPHFNETVNPEFKNKVQFIEAGLQKNSIVIRNVTEEDEGCYYCLFNTYTDGSLIGQTCLRVYELHEPVLHVREASSPEESVVSCSATGGPAPTVTLTVPQQHLHFSQYNTTRVTNTNNTVTVTTTAVLSGLHDDSTQVRCAARVDSGPQVEVMKRISEFKQTSDDASGEKSPAGFHEKQRSKEQNFLWIVLIVLLVTTLCVFAFCSYWLHKKIKYRDPENMKTPKKKPQDSNKIRTPLVQQENENLRLRSPAKKKPENNRSSPLSPKRLFEEECCESDSLT